MFSSSDSRKELNEVLRQLCATLQNDLVHVKEETAALQLQLEHLST